MVTRRVRHTPRSPIIDQCASTTTGRVVVCRSGDRSWVVDIPSIVGCRALMDTREAALAELGRVFRLIVEEHQERGQPLPKDTTEIVQT